MVIIILYFAIVLAIGIVVSRRSIKDIDSYFLGSNKLPWWMLGISNASGMFDITGTMWLVYLLFVYGMKSVWIPWLWPIFNQVFLFAYLSIWLRRSNVMTGAQWIETRFGNGKGARLAHIIVVCFALVSVVGFIAYDFKGIGKFAKIFLPWDLSPDTYAIILMSITAIYAVKGGMVSVVATEVLQFLVMTVASVAVGIVAMNAVAPEALNAVIPSGWKELFFGWHLNLDWTGIMDSVNTKIAEDGYELFMIFMMMVLFKGILVSAAGPAPNYDMQRILATKDTKEASKMSWLVSLVLFFPRYMMIAGLTVLALVYLMPELKAMGPNVDFEMILPLALKDLIPVGLVGVLLAGLLAAFMSTYAATINAAPAYVVNDIYKKFINPNAHPKKYVHMSIAVSVFFVILGFVFGIMVQSVNQITLWIVNGLWGGYTAANVLKWYWWRMNGYGYFWGMVIGIAAALMMPVVFPALPALNAFPYVLAISVLGSVLGSYLTEPEPDNVLMKFYVTVRPWGLWKPVHEKVKARFPEFNPNLGFKRDMFNVVIGIVWQTTLLAAPIYLVIHEYTYFAITLGVTAVTSIILKFTWWNKLDEICGEETEKIYREIASKIE
ncbi:Na+/solute symporter [Melioribacter roseus P3M-2]|uniref:Na+/solute symporter n=1 Tax=Melioribacter roseus (strain DSM 23840 / JCM 17771 / VKM B-2668 / P3M-2) TaxID=1191523 RepID=I6YT68_MELRP|nr:Na+/solute symporter [Melioribacter roseus P3M-2]